LMRSLLAFYWNERLLHSYILVESTQSMVF